ncbi:nadph dehydrogenase [Moniliophthora roreri MCA 2997]|uniref:Nadph dehydrogenase n=1 Tax=Moniliophthora roreri (strain MCA 2997) TaxID=1381753 RepID=V2WYE9_MONRO|nr:nadph dehydrogenase [Moniliophthora roreri MCA 2997]
MATSSKILDLPSEPTPGIPYFSPNQTPPAGTAIQEEGKQLPLTFQPFKIRGLEFQNRIAVAPLCQYSAEDGFVTPWHMAHIGGIVQRGPGLTFVEATAVESRGRITPEDTGIWSDEHIQGWRDITTYAHSQNQKIGIQLAHAGRKASCVAPFISFGMQAIEKVGGWPNDVVGPSNEPWSETYPTPKALTTEEVKGIVNAFKDAAVRAVKAGFDVIQIHNAHGYLLHSFVSPYTNKRTDEYGGSFENRIRLSVEIVDAVREVIPVDMPLYLRISATDFLEESLPDAPSWRVEDTIRFAHIVAEHGVDAIDISSGGNSQHQKLGTFGSNVQHLFAEQVHSSFTAKNQLVGAVGSINTGHIAEEVLQSSKADFVSVGRHFQKNPGAVWQFAEDLDVEIYLAKQIGWGFGGRGKRSSRKSGKL